MYPSSSSSQPLKPCFRPPKPLGLGGTEERNASEPSSESKRTAADDSEAPRTTPASAAGVGTEPRWAERDLHLGPWAGRCGADGGGGPPRRFARGGGGERVGCGFQKRENPRFGAELAAKLWAIRSVLRLIPRSSNYCVQNFCLLADFMDEK